MFSRLETINPALARELELANAIQQRRAAVEASSTATLEIGAVAPPITLAAETLTARSGVENRANLIKELKSLASSMDEAYIRASEDGNAVHALRLFSQARVANAWYFVLSSAYDEAVYEAMSACDDPAVIEQVVRHALTKAAT